MSSNSFVEPLPVANLSVEDYEFFLRQDWPLNSLRQKYGLFFKLIVTPCFYIDEAVTFNIGNLDSAILQEKISQKSYRRWPKNKKVPPFGYWEWTTEDTKFQDAAEFLEDAKKRASVEDILRQDAKKINPSVDVSTIRFDPSSSMAIDKVIDDASKLKVPYSNIMKFSSRSRRNDKIFHHPSHLNSPLNYALEEGAVTGIHHPLLYVGPPFSATFFHRDDGLLPVVNYQ
ncbi:unnamed protein product, partial [Allacma fusca]